MLNSISTYDFLRKTSPRCRIFGQDASGATSSHQTLVHPAVTAENAHHAWGMKALYISGKRLMGKSPFLMGKSPFLIGKSQFLMGKSTISMAIFNSYVKLPEGTSLHPDPYYLFNIPLIYPYIYIHASWCIYIYNNIHRCIYLLHYLSISLSLSPSIHLSINLST